MYYTIDEEDFRKMDKGNRQRAEQFEEFEGFERFEEFERRAYEVTVAHCSGLVPLWLVTLDIVP